MGRSEDERMALLQKLVCELLSSPGDLFLRIGSWWDRRWSLNSIWLARLTVSRPLIILLVEGEV